MTKKIRLLLMGLHILLMLAILGACGSNDSPKATNDVTVNEPEVSEAENDEANGGETSGSNGDITGEGTITSEMGGTFTFISRCSMLQVDDDGSHKYLIYGDGKDKEGEVLYI